MLRATVWAGGGHAMSQIIRLGGNLVLARLLMPEAFGLMAIIAMMLLALELLSDIGTGTIIVQSQRGDDADFQHTAWSLQIIRGFVIWAFALVMAGVLFFGQANGLFAAGTVYGDPMLPPMVAVAGFGMVIGGFVSIKRKLAERRLDLKAVSVIEMAVQVLVLIVMIVAAYQTRSVWALVIGGLVTPTLQCIFSHVFLPGPRARFRLEGAAIRELIGKGKWVLLSSLFGFFAINGDRLLLGGLVDSATLGLYSIAFGLATVAPTVLSTLLAKVIYPAFSEVVRERPADLRATYWRFQQVTDACVGVIAGALFIASHQIIGIMYDARYQAAGHIFAILTIGSIGSRFLVVEQIYVAQGRTSLLAAAITPRVLVLLLGLPIGFSVSGLNGALWAIVLSQFAHWPLAVWFRFESKLNDFRKDIVLPVALLVGGGMGWVLIQLMAIVR